MALGLNKCERKMRIQKDLGHEIREGAAWQGWVIDEARDMGMKVGKNTPIAVLN